MRTIRVFSVGGSIDKIHIDARFNIGAALSALRCDYLHERQLFDFGKVTKDAAQNKFMSL